MASHATCLTSVSKYCGRMASGGVWGGGIEMAALSHSRRVNVHVYQVGVTLQRLRVTRWLHLTRHDVPYQFPTIPEIAFTLPPPPLLSGVLSRIQTDFLLQCGRRPQNRDSCLPGRRALRRARARQQIVTCDRHSSGSTWRVTARGERRQALRPAWCRHWQHARWSRVQGRRGHVLLERRGVDVAPAWNHDAVDRLELLSAT